MTETPRQTHCSQLARANSGPVFPCRLRSSTSDFKVDEVLTFDLTGEGEHVYLHIRKTGLNTEDVAKQITRLTGVKPRDVSYAGLKDRNAVTSQWFSVYLPGKLQLQPAWQQLESDSLQILHITRHRQKLRRGAIKANQFVLVLREVRGEQQAVEQCLQRLHLYGVPNYFGEQRFGVGEANIQKAHDMLTGKLKVKSRHQRSLYLSAARSLLFNLVLSARVKRGNWNQAITGDAMMLDGSHSFFVIDALDETIQQRVMDFDIHPTGPLWGSGELVVHADARQMELTMLQNELEIRNGLERAGVEQQRRALRVRVQDLQHEWLADDTLQLRFSLESGAYATSVLRECFTY